MDEILGIHQGAARGQEFTVNNALKLNIKEANMRAYLLCATVLGLCVAIPVSTWAQEEAPPPPMAEDEEILDTGELLPGALIEEQEEAVLPEEQVSAQGADIPEEQPTEDVEAADSLEQELIDPEELEGASSAAVVTQETEVLVDSADMDDEGEELIDLEMVQEIEPGLAVEEEEAQDLITISLDEVPIQDVIRMFTRISGANIVAGTNLQGSVTVSLQDVEWEPALRVILDTVDLTMVERDEGIYGIIRKSDLAAEPVTVDTVFLNYTTVSNVLPIVNKMLVSTNSSVSGFPSANAIIVQETANHLERIKTTVKRLDIPRKQVFIEAKFVELNDEAIKDLGINWEVLQGYTVGASDMAWQYQATREWVKGNEKTSSQWDKRSQVDGLDRVYDMYGDEYQDGSSSYEEVPPESDNFILVKDNEPTRSLVDTIDLGKEIQQNLKDSFNKSVADVRTAVLSADQFQLTLSALKQNNGADVVSNPKIIVASGESAKIHVGRRDPILKRDTDSKVETVTYSFDRYQDSGVELEVVPIVHTKDEISLYIQPQLSRVLGYAQSGDANIQIPILSTRTIRSKFNLTNGKTAAIGGLTETQKREQVKKIPLLGDIPIIGKYLFSHTHEENVQDEIIIFVTVQVAKAQDLREESGIPEGGRLIHQQLIMEREARQSAL
jgi:type II secretory pathway component GspD/PulD (secretin)